jgi:hypothetical protein
LYQGYGAAKTYFFQEYPAHRSVSNENVFGDISKYEKAPLIPGV